MSLSTVTPTLDVDTTTTVGLCGDAGTQASSWNSSDYGDATALVFQP